MERNNQKNCLYRIMIFSVVLLFAVCLTMNVFLGNNFDLYELLDKTISSETWTVSDGVVVDGDSDDFVCFKHSFLNQNAHRAKTIMKNISPIPVIADIPKGFRLFLFRMIDFLFLNLFILLSDKWTLINQKVRLDI